MAAKLEAAAAHEEQDDKSSKKTSWWDAYAKDVLEKSQDRRGQTAIFSRWLTLRIMPADIRTKHHKEVFGPLLAPGEPLFAAYETIGKKWDEVYGFEAGKRPTTKMVQQEVVSYMTVSNFERVLTRQIPYATLQPDDVLRLLTHVKEEWVRKRNFVLRIIPDQELLSSRLAFQTGVWDTIAKASSLAIWRALDYSLFWFKDGGEDGKRVTETNNLLERIHKLSYEVPWTYYLKWARLLDEYRPDIRPSVAQYEGCLHELAEKFQRAKREPQREAEREIAEEYSDIVERLIRSDKWEKRPPFGDELPEHCMPRAFYDYWSRSASGRRRKNGDASR